MNNNPLVSIIIPAYNAENFLEDTLNSVIKSNYSPLEIIVINDGSTDKTLDIAENFARNNANIKVINQKNTGVCKARNNAISQACGKYILPVDADDLIEPTFVPLAVNILENDSEVKVVQPQSDFFGDRTGYWHLPSFSLQTLAKRNIIAACAMYRKADWERIGGYCEEIIAREDWEFWIAMLKDGGKVERLNEVVFHYRVRKTGKRKADRKYNNYVIKVLNARHSDFFKRELGGKLRRMRSWSVFINKCVNLFSCKN